MDGNTVTASETTAVEVATEQVPANINTTEEALIANHQLQQQQHHHHLQQQLQLQQQQLQQALQVQRTPSPQDVKPPVDEKSQVCVTKITLEPI